ncbi:MAG: hypothetical protein H5U22_26510 [Rhizobium sp.]|nr:hypothetical protein [Parvibaculum sp.]MBC7152926.1 hypothetical protein [Rhizobium sp.]
MISSRCNDRFPLGDPDSETLSQIRGELKKEIENVELFGKKLFEVWINESAPPKAANWDSWDTCLEAVTDCDILLVLSNGNAGWAGELGHVGICHAELMRGLSEAPGKVWLISIGNVPLKKGDKDYEPNKKFQDYVSKQNLFRGSEAKTIKDLKLRVNEALGDAILNLTRKGSRESGRGKYSTGDALNWSRMDFVSRQGEMIRVLREVLKERSDAIEVGADVAVSVGGSKSVLFKPTAIPSAVTVAAAREMVGQPFLRDHEIYDGLKSIDAIGPVHLIGCQKTITESQAIRLLGFPDATIVTTPYGVYVADDIQKIQMLLIANCRDETTTRHGVQRLFEWLDQTGEGAALASRAASRRKIIKAISEERREDSRGATVGGAKSARKLKKR